MSNVIRSQSVLKSPFGWNDLIFNKAEIPFNCVARRKNFYTYRAFAALCTNDGFIRPLLIKKRG